VRHSKLGRSTSVADISQRPFNVRFCFDNRGTGRTDCPDRPYSTKLFADDTVGLMDAIGIERAHIYGISMGGGIVQEIAINHPHRTLSLVINCSFAKMDRYGARVTENIMNVYKAQGPHEAARHMTLFCYTLPYFNTHKDEIDTKQKSIGDAQRPAHAFIRSTEACIGHDARSRLNQIRVPTLVNCGSEDTWCSVGCSQELARLIPGAKLKLYPNSSHFFLNEHFDQSRLTSLHSSARRHCDNDDPFSQFREAFHGLPPCIVSHGIPSASCQVAPPRRAMISRRFIAALTLK
jgi:pimeloyl-ACP methyl ester carboxylesterase